MQSDRPSGPARPFALRLRAPGRLSRLGLRFGPLVLLALFMAPARNAALRGDDEWTFYLRGYLELTHQSIWNQIWYATKDPFVQGRPTFMGAIEGDSVLWVFQGHPTEYHVFIIALTVVCGALLWTLVRRLTESERLAGLTVLLFAAFVQFRFYDDTMLGYYGGVQDAVIFLLGSLITLLNVLRGGRAAWGWALATAVLFALACATEEWVYPLMIIHVLLVLVDRRDVRGLLTAALPPVVVGVVFFLLSLKGTTAQSRAALGTLYTPVYNVGKILHALVVTWVPPLPTSYRIFALGPTQFFYGSGTPYQLGGSLTPAEWLAATWRGIVVFIAVAGFCRWGRGVRRPTAPSVPRSALRLAAVGVPLWLVTPLLISVSAKYELEGSLARGYLETFAQVIGVALLAVALLIWLLELAQRRGRRIAVGFGALAAIALGFAAAVDGFNNIRVIALEQPVRNTQNLLQNAAHNGVFAAVPNRSALLFSSIDMDWPSGGWNVMPYAGDTILYSDTHPHKLFDVRPTADWQPINCPRGPTFPPAVCSLPRPSSYWVRVRATLKGGAVIVSRITRPTAHTLQAAPALDVTVYTQQIGTTDPAPPPLSGVQVDAQPWSDAGVKFRKVRWSGDWAIYTATMPSSGGPEAQTITDPLSPVDFDHPLTPDAQAREFGTKELLP